MARKPASETPVRSGLSAASMSTRPAASMSTGPAVSMGTGPAASMSAAPPAPAPTVSPETPVPLAVPVAKAPARARPVTASSREYAVCDLCGEQLGRHAGHFHMVSPLTARHVSVCRTCRRAALSEGYRPRA